MGHQPIHLPHHIDRHALAPPLLALHQDAPAIATQNQIDAAVGATQTGFLDAVTATAEGFANQPLEVAPAQCGDAFQTGACVQQPAGAPRFEK